MCINPNGTKWVSKSDQLDTFNVRTIAIPFAGFYSWISPILDTQICHVCSKHSFKLWDKIQYRYVCWYKLLCYSLPARAFGVPCCKHGIRVKGHKFKTPWWHATSISLSGLFVPFVFRLSVRFRIRTASHSRGGGVFKLLVFLVVNNVVWLKVPIYHNISSTMRSTMSTIWMDVHIADECKSPG